MSNVIPHMKCTECGNINSFDVTFAASTLEIEYRKGKVPLIQEWTDTGQYIDMTCFECGSKDIEIDEDFFQ